MMKNSKLSKLLVAGVSVAMLASALAPMAFAEEESVTSENAVLNVYFVAKSLDDGKFTVTSDTTKWAGYDVVLTSFTKSELEDSNADYIDFGVYTPANYKEVDYYEISWPDNVSTTQKKLSKSSTGISVEELLTRVGKTVNEVKEANTPLEIHVDVVTKDKDYVTVKFDTVGNDAEGWTAAAITNLEGNTFVDNNGSWNETKKIVINDVINLPSFTITTEDMYFAGYVIKNTTSGEYINSKKDLYNGTQLILNSDDVDAKDSIEIYPVIRSIETVGLELSKDAAINPTNNKAFDDVAGKDYSDRVTLSAYPVSGTATVKYGDTVKLPVLTTETAGWTFSHWQTKKDVEYLKADGETKVKNYAFTDGIFDPTMFNANEDVVLVPVFVKGTTPESVTTYDPAKTPNDKVKKYVDGKFVADVVYGTDIEFDGGLFFNQVDETFAYYLPINSQGKWVIDTTVNGLVDGVVYDKGVQDTKACGLYKVSDKDTFSYLVSNGAYLADYGEYNEDEKRYEGLWISEDKVWYYLVNGCCQTPADGVYEHTNGWYYNFKDGKMVETNGFQMHGTDFYWFVKGECKPEGGADCVEWDGDLYYIEGGKFVPTFNDTFKGSVFVNGVCDK